MPTQASKTGKILLGISGGIAAYKMPMLVRLLKKAGLEVKVIMTPSARQFVTAETLAVVSENPVITEFFDASGNWNNHVELGLWADLMLIAPATATTLAKMATGIADNALLTTYFSARCPVMVAPAMDLDMYQHETVHQNIKLLEKHGVVVIPAEDGPLASGLSGQGRMPEPETLFDVIIKQLNPVLPLKGKNVMVTAGPTYENLDPVRFIGNYSSGKMGYAIADSFAKQGANVTLISGPVSIEAPKHVHRISVQSAQQMHDACLIAAKNADIVVMAAAVADYRPEITESQKIKKQDMLTLNLVKNPDILNELGAIKPAGQTLIGFALESQNEMQFASEKLQRKNLDAIVLNSLADEGAGFAHDTNKVTIIYKNGDVNALPLMSKTAVASEIVNEAIRLHFSNTFANS